MDTPTRVGVLQLNDTASAPTGGVDRYLLVLRLYDTPIGVATRTGRDAPMPAITRGGCP